VFFKKIGKNMFNPVTKTFQYGDQKVSIETGKIARQATGSVMIHMGQTQVSHGRREEKS